MTATNASTTSTTTSASTTVIKTTDPSSSSPISSNIDKSSSVNQNIDSTEDNTKASMDGDNHLEYCLQDISSIGTIQSLTQQPQTLSLMPNSPSSFNYNYSMLSLSKSQIKPELYQLAFDVHLDNNEELGPDFCEEDYEATGTNSWSTVTIDDPTSSPSELQTPTSPTGLPSGGVLKKQTMIIQNGSTTKTTMARMKNLPYNSSGLTWINPTNAGNAVPVCCCCLM